MKIIKYSELTRAERMSVREKYIKLQKGNCLYCHESLTEKPPKLITEKPIDWNLFPPNFLKYPIHLQHNHASDQVEGAVHAYCNAVMWQYEKR